MCKFIGLSGFTVQSMIVYGVNLFTIPLVQRVVYANKVVASPYCNQLFICQLSIRLLSISFKPIKAVRAMPGMRRVVYALEYIIESLCLALC